MDFIFETLAVWVESDAPPDLEWLAEFMGPACRTREHPCTGSRDASRTVRLRADAALHAEYGARIASGAAHEDATAFVMDSGAVTLRVFADGGVRVAHDPAFDAFYRIVTPHSVEIIDVPRDAGASPRRARGALMRIVREWVTHSARRAGHLALHAAGIAHDGRAILLAGPKNSGKTTLAAACLLHGDRWGLLANDRILLRRGKLGWVCRGMASIVSVRPGTVGQLPSLRGRLDQLTGRALAAHHEPPSEPYLVNGRMSLSPPQFASALGAALIGEAAACAVAFPRIDRAGEGIRCSRLGSDEATDRLASTLFAATMPGAQSDLLEEPCQVARLSADAIRAQVAGLAAGIPCFEVGLGRSAYSPAEVTRLLRALAG